MHKIAEAHLYSGLRGVKGSLAEAGEIQVKDGEGWRKVASFSGNREDELRIRIEPPVETASLRLWLPRKEPVAVRELALFSEPAELGTGVVFHKYPDQQVLVNQLAYNDGAPKRFTVPTATREGATFTIRRKGGDKALFSGKVVEGTGDFSAWKGGGAVGDYVVRVEGGGLEPGESQPFTAGPRALQRSLLQPLVDFMIDSRSVVGTHPSGYGGGAWRDGSYYTHELASLVMLYLAFPEELEKLPRQIDWNAERNRVLAEGFKLVPTKGDREMLEGTRRYYQAFQPPAEDAPDIVKLIHWGLGMTLTRPELFDPSGDGIGLKVHSQLVEQVAYVLAVKPRLRKWFSEDIFNSTDRFVDRHWDKSGLLKIPQTWNPAEYVAADDPRLKKMSGPILNPYKGRHVPGHSILPNLLMYEVAKRDKKGEPYTYLRAAISQAEFVLREMDWSDPRHTKGHRMSEHKMIAGLVWLRQNHPKQAPAGMDRKLEQWADVAISRSENYWDFRRYDLGENWTIPVMNEPGNLAGFPACALSVAWGVEDPAKKQRLREIAFAAIDTLFGRNPINAASPHHPELGWNGMLEKGWPAGFPNGTTARLELCRGALSSGPGSEMYPYNPGGRYRFPEGWTAFNAAMNVGLAYIEFDGKGIASLPEDCRAKADE